MSSAFVKEGEYQKLSDTDSSLSALSILPAYRVSGHPANEKVA